jgi:translation elongation factor EF-4
LAVINKVDLPHAAPVETSEQIVASLGLSADKHMRISAKSGLGVDEVLNQIIDGLPAPQPWEEQDGKLRGLVFDHLYVATSDMGQLLMISYDHFRGVVALVRVFSGSIKKGDKIRFLQSDRKYEVLEVGIQNPEEVIVDELGVGQVG